MLADAFSHCEEQPALVGTSAMVRPARPPGLREERGDSLSDVLRCTKNYPIHDLTVDCGEVHIVDEPEACERLASLGQEPVKFVQERPNGRRVSAQGGVVADGVGDHGPDEGGGVLVGIRERECRPLRESIRVCLAQGLYESVGTIGLANLDARPVVGPRPIVWLFRMLCPA